MTDAVAELGLRIAEFEQKLGIPQGHVIGRPVGDATEVPMRAVKLAAEELANKFASLANGQDTLVEWAFHDMSAEGEAASWLCSCCCCCCSFSCCCCCCCF